MARTKPKPSSPIVLLHPFAPDGTYKGDHAPDGLCAEQPTNANDACSYTAAIASGSNYPEFTFVFDCIIARDPDGIYWCRYWGDEVWQRMPSPCPSSRYEYCLGRRTRK